MQVRVRLVAGLSRLAGRPRLELSLDDGATVADALARLAAEHPELKAGLRSALPVVNGSHADGAQELHERDEVSLLSPVAGGS